MREFRPTAERATMLTPEQAYRIASELGASIHAGDPGGVFNCFVGGRASVTSEAHRASLLAIAHICLGYSEAKLIPQSRDTLRQLLEYFEKASLQE